MEEFRKGLQERRECVLSGLRVKMDALRSENMELKRILNDHKIEYRVPEIIKHTESHSDAVEVVPEANDAERDNLLKTKTELSATQNDLQEANSRILTLTSELDQTRNHCQTLKEVNRITKQLISIREDEVLQLKEKLKEIEATIGDRETELMSETLREEYTRQLENIRRLKTLYEQRARSADAEIASLKRKLDEKNKEIDNEILKNREKQQTIDDLEAEVSTLKSEQSATIELLKDTKNELVLQQNDLHTINLLFTRILFNYNRHDNNAYNLDKLKAVLEENRLLLTEVTKRSNSMSIIADPMLPKLLCDLIVDAFATDTGDETSDLHEDVQNEEQSDDLLLTTNEIIDNLPKIWRILTELLSHQSKIDPIMLMVGDNGTASSSDDCYKSVDTLTGTQRVLSVSKTFIKLKNLILEKKSLQKQTMRMKALSTYLQHTLDCQEKRLGAIGLELTKTWHLVNRMQRQHRKLHTHEQVTRYNLQQKRRVLSVLKEELESCRHKWTKAREKNEDSEHQWQTLRDEFSSRRLEQRSCSTASGLRDEPVKYDADDMVKDNIEAHIETANESLEKMFYRLNAIHSNNRNDNHANDLVQPVWVDNALVQSTSSAVPVPSVQETTTGSNANVPSPITAQPGSSTSDAAATETVLTDAEREYTTRRSERIKELEEQCQSLMTRVNSNNQRGDDLLQHLETFHASQTETTQDSVDGPEVTNDQTPPPPSTEPES